MLQPESILYEVFNQLEVERAYFFQALKDLDPLVILDEPEPVKIALEPASSPSFLLKKS